MAYQIILASASPRRKELLKRIFESFEIVPADVDESLLEGETVEETVLRLARIKAEAVFAGNRDALVIGSDTLVALDGQILGKPTSKEDACSMLNLLSGKTHQVLTGVACFWPSGQFDFTEVAKVTFRNISAEEIKAYVETGEPLDKAGSYAIQGGAGEFVTNIEGDLDTVVGLPVASLAAKLGLYNLK